MKNAVPIDYEAVIAGMDEDIHELTEQVRELASRVASLEAKGK